MADYEGRSNKFLLRGMNLTLPGDRLGLEWAQLLRNLRSYRVGEWRQRPGLTEMFDTGTGSPVLWATRLNDPQGGSKLLAGTESGAVYDELGALLDSGYGGEGYGAFTARPDASPQPFVFLGNAQRHSKFSTTGARTAWGLRAPTAEPQLELELPAYGIVDRAAATAGYVATGGALTAPVRVSSTIARILYDRGADRWACVQPAAMDDQWQEGMLLEMVGETVIVGKVFPAITSTTVQSIAYDVGATGECCVQLTTPTAGLERDMLLVIGTEPVRVLSVTLGLDQVPSFRCATTGTHSAGETVTGVRSLRAACALTHLAGEALTANYLQLAVAASGLSSVSQAGAKNLAHTTATYQRPMSGEDYIHLSVKVADWASVTEVQIQFDVDAAVNDFTRNYYYKSVRPPDLLAAVQQTASSLTAQQTAIQRQQIDQLTSERDALEASLGSNGGSGTFFGEGLDDVRQQRLAQIRQELDGFTVESGQGPISTEGSTGAAQWTELRIPIQEFQRVGADTTRDWANVQAWRVTFNTTAAVNVGINAVWFGGTFGPSEAEAGGLNYVYRMRNSSTGSRSAFSPPARAQVFPRREGVLVRGEALYTDTQSDVIDYFRIGGTLGQYYYVGTAPLNDPTLLDTLDDGQASRNEIAEFDHWRPWVTNDVPQSGTCDVVGTTARITSGQLDVDYVRLNEIVIDGKLYTFYANPSSAAQVQLNESGGTLVGVDWKIANPTLEGQPLPVVFGPYAGPSAEFYFGLGDARNPGVLYFTEGNDPEGQSDVGYIELSSPSEPLIGGCLLDGRAFVWSCERSWIILPSFNGGQSAGGSLFYPQETAMGKGLAGPWALAAGDMLYWVAPDGVWSSKGDAIASLTDESLSALFKHDGTYVEGAPFQGVWPAAFDAASLPSLSLAYSKDGLYLTYKGINNAYFSAFYSFLTKGWVEDRFAPGASRFVRAEGAGVDEVLVCGRDGRVYALDSSATSDAGVDIACKMITREENWDDSRAQKQLGDVMVDVNPGSATLQALLQLEGGATIVGLDALNGSERQVFVRDIGAGAGVLATRAALELNWTTSSGRAYLYEWQPSALAKAAMTMERATDWDKGGYPGAKWLQGVRLVCDTYGAPKTIRVQADGADIAANAQQTFTANGEMVVALSWPPVVCHEMRVIGDDATEWRLLEPPEWIFQPEPESAMYWETQFTSMDQTGYLHIHDVLLAHRSANDIFMAISVDEGAEDTYQVLASGATRRAKTYVPLLAKKGKLFRFRFFSTSPAALYMMDIEVRAKSWGIDGSQYQVVKPFGDLSRTNGGAKI